MDNQIDTGGSVTYVDNFLRWNGTSENISKKAHTFFGLLVKDIKISDIFYKRQNFLNTSWASIITTYLIKLLSTKFRIISCSYLIETSLLRRLQVQTLSYATPPIGIIHQISKIPVTFEPILQFWCLLRFRIYKNI